MSFPDYRNFAPRLRGLIQENPGAATVENALLMALIVGTLYLTVESLGLFAERTFASTAKCLSSAPASVLAEKSPDCSPSAVVGQIASVGISPLARLGILVGFCVGGTGCWFLLKHKQHCQKEETEPQPAEAEVEIDQRAIFAKRHRILRILSADVGILLDSRMHIEHLMSRRLSTVKPGETAAEVRRRFEEERIRHLMVCDAQGRLTGVISDRDLAKQHAQCARDFMTPAPLTIRPDSLAAPAVTLLIQNRISCLPVVENERLVGVVTTTDLMMALQCALQALQKVAAEIAAQHVQENR